MIKIDSKEKLNTFFKVLAEESVSVALRHEADKEKEIQQDISSRTAKHAVPGEPEQDPDRPQSGDEEVPDDEAPEGERLNVDLDMTKKQLNTIRAGHSLKGERTGEELQSYWEGLSRPEQITLFKFLQDLAAIISLGEEGDQVPGPEQDDAPPQVDIEFANSDSKKSASNDPEDMSAPIKVGESKMMESMREHAKKLLANN